MAGHLRLPGQLLPIHLIPILHFRHPNPLGATFPHFSLRLRQTVQPLVQRSFRGAGSNKLLGSPFQPEVRGRPGAGFRRRHPLSLSLSANPSHAGAQNLRRLLCHRPFQFLMEKLLPEESSVLNLQSKKQ